MTTIQELRHALKNALYTLNLAYSLLEDAPPVSIDSRVRDAREAMQRLQIAHENYIRAHEEKAGSHAARTPAE
jgi:hypothetical protein